MLHVSSETDTSCGWKAARPTSVRRLLSRFWRAHLKDNVTLAGQSHLHPRTPSQTRPPRPQGRLLARLIFLPQPGPLALPQTSHCPRDVA